MLAITANRIINQWSFIYHLTLFSHYANSVTQTVEAVVAAFLIYAILLPEATLKNATVLAGIIALVVMVAVGLEPNAT